MILFIQHSRNDEIIEIGKQDEWCQGLREGEGRAWAAAEKDSMHNPEVELTDRTPGDHTIRLTFKKVQVARKSQSRLLPVPLPTTSPTTVRSLSPRTWQQDPTFTNHRAAIQCQITEQAPCLKLSHLWAEV